MKSSPFLAVVLAVLSLAFSAPLNPVLHVTTCTTDSECGTDEYCDQTGTCQDLGYTSVVNANGNAAVDDATDYSLIIASDIQYFFTNCKDQPSSSCIFHALSGSDDKVLRDALKSATERQLNCIVSLSSTLSPKPVAVFDNGDITNGGKAGELMRVQRQFHDKVRSGTNLPLVVGLGNHDYNVDFPSDSRVRMVDYLDVAVDLMHQKLEIRAIDFERTPAYTNINGDKLRRTRGSMAYSFQVNGYLFVMLHWSTAINGGRFTSTFEDDTVNSYKDIVNITSVDDFLFQELGYAYTNGLKVILVPHSYRGFQRYFNRLEDQKDDLVASSVVAIISGHDHDNWGYYEDYTMDAHTTTASKTIPVYYVGSASYEKFITFSTDLSAGTFSIQSWDSSVAGACSKTTDDNDDDPIL